MPTLRQGAAPRLHQAQVLHGEGALAAWLRQQEREGARRKRAAKSAAKAAKAAFSDGIDSWMRRLRNIDIDVADDEEEEDAGIPDEHGVDSWLRRLRFDDGSDGAGGGGDGGLVA